MLHLKEFSRTGTNCSERLKCERPTRHWTRCSTAGCCTRRFRVASGRALRSISQAALIGFRDQLQDVMALVYSRPDVARKQIVLAAATPVQRR